MSFELRRASWDATRTGPSPEGTHASEATRAVLRFLMMFTLFGDRVSRKLWTAVRKLRRIFFLCGVRSGC